MINDAIQILQELENFCYSQTNCKHCPFFKGSFEETTANGKETFVMCINEDNQLSDIIRDLKERREEKCTRI